MPPHQSHHEPFRSTSFQNFSAVIFDEDTTPRILDQRESSTIPGISSRSVCAYLLPANER